MTIATSTLETLLDALQPRRIAVIGDVMLDHYITGRVERLSPEAPIQVLDVQDEYKAPGGASNVAMKVVGLGSRVQMVGLVGDDHAAHELRSLLRAHPDVIDSLISDPERNTTVKTRLIAQHQQLLRVDRERRGVPSEAVRARLAEAARAAASEADAVILEDYGKGVLSPEVIQAAIAVANARGIPVVVDPNGRDYRRYAGCTVLTPNLKEAELAAEQPITNAASLEAAAATLVSETRAALAITRDAKGISLFRRDESAPSGLSHVHIPTVPVEVYDVTGAGDAVAATLAIALACGVELAQSCALANLAGRAVVRQLGVGTISIGQLRNEARCEQIERSAKVVDSTVARRRAQAVQQSGGKVVFTNGCFDILHYGHAYLLQFAREQGDMLILGLNSDASVSRFKGPDRPLVPEDQRSYMLSLYPFIDMVVLFDEDTPAALIEAVRPDIIVKGGDYTPDTVVGREFVESYGGRVVICPRLEGLSTSNLVSKMRQS
ncbi:MAG: D-glycero-beta-D-manno-heptose 1-phosphate adenylyltransferase [Isosphaeraceae bacterium]